MSERIIELANEANKDIGYTFKMEEAKQLHELMEKFAELIVRECMKAADEGMAQVTMKVEWPSYHIKKHFGVE